MKYYSPLNRQLRLIKTASFFNYIQDCKAFTYLIESGYNSALPFELTSVTVFTQKDIVIIKYISNIK